MIAFRGIIRYSHFFGPVLTKISLNDMICDIGSSFDASRSGVNGPVGASSIPPKPHGAFLTDR